MPRWAPPLPSRSKPKLDYGKLYKLVDYYFPSLRDKLKAYEMWKLGRHLWKNAMERARGEPITPLPGYEPKVKKKGNWK